MTQDTKKAQAKAKAKATPRATSGPLLTLPLSRPATPQDIIDLARQHGPACLEALADVMANGTDTSRVSAAKELLDRGFGKVGQPLEVTGKDGGALEVTLEVTPVIAAALQTLRGVVKP